MARPAKPKPPPEYDLHTDVVKLFERALLPPVEWTCFPSGNMPLPARYAAKLKRMGLKRAWPDFLIVHDRIYGIELKRVGAGLSRTRTIRNRRGAMHRIEGQREVFPRLEKAGMTIAVCRTIEEVMNALLRWGVPVLWATSLAEEAAHETSAGQGRIGSLSP